MNNSEVLLLGLDVGTTTTSCLIASASVSQSPVTGQSILDEYKVLAMHGPIFTPYLQHANHDIDSYQIEKLVASALANPLINGKALFSSGALITGLAAKKSNAVDVSQSIRKMLPNSILAIAGDPHYESWLAFMANAAEISEAYPQTPVINLDIGGGTTNIAIGINGEITATGSYYIGARHFEFEPGTYQLKNISSIGSQVLNHLSIQKELYEAFSEEEITLITQLFISQLEKIILYEPPLDFMIEAPLAKMSDVPLKKSIITLSGGVGALFYQKPECHNHKKTHFGDLGLELASKLRVSTQLNQVQMGSKTIIPKSLGRATLYGLAFHSAELSGKTTFISNSIPLPLEDIPSLGVIEPNMKDSEIRIQFSRLAGFQNGAAYHFLLGNLDAKDLMRFSSRVSAILSEFNHNQAKPLIFFVSKNIGLTFGNLITEWRNLHKNLFVLDEVPQRSSQLVRVGRQNKGVVPVHYYACRTNKICINSLNKEGEPL